MGDANGRRIGGGIGGGTERVLVVVVVVCAEVLAVAGSRVEGIEVDDAPTTDEFVIA